MNKFKFPIIFFFIVSACRVFGQSPTNLEMFQKLIDESVDKVNSNLNISEGSREVHLSIPSSLEQLKPGIIKSFMSKGYTISQNNLQDNSVSYLLNSASVSYGDSFTDGLFGEVLSERNLFLTGSFYSVQNGKIGMPAAFDLSCSDTVKVDEIQQIENKSLLFTQGKPPEPPFFSNLLEPIIVVGTLITTVILLFTVRSK